MKNRPRSLGAILLFLLSAATISHAQISGDFSYTTTAGQATITGDQGEGAAVTIPPTLDGLPVTRIGSKAFYGCGDLTSVTIPDGDPKRTNTRPARRPSASSASADIKGRSRRTPSHSLPTSRSTASNLSLIQHLLS